MVAQPPVSSPETSATDVSTIDQLLEKLHQLSPEQQQEVHDFVQFLILKYQPAQKTIWEKMRERTARIPAEELEKLPTDGAAQHDHYLYDAPKREL